jgi:AcrR family transcriptional regulator
MLRERQERYDEKLVQILESACGIFAEKGYHHASVRDAAAATGVSPAGLYYYFKSKEELLFLILDHCLVSLLAVVRKAAAGVNDPAGRIRTIIRSHLQFFMGHRDEMRVLAQEWESLSGRFRADILARQREYAAVVLRTLRELRPDQSRKELRASAMALFGILTWMYQWHRPQRDLPTEELADHLAGIFLDGFLRGGRTRNAPAPGSGKTRADTPWAQGERPPSVLSGPAF